jgi:hypothetical protein
MNTLIDYKRTGERVVLGTTFGIERQLRRLGPHTWQVIRGLCNGVPESSETYETRREAREAFDR